MAGTKRIRYQWMWHKVKSAVEQRVANKPDTIDKAHPLFLAYRDNEMLLDYMQTLENDEYERVFDEEAYENKIKRSNARKRH